MIVCCKRCSILFPRQHQCLSPQEAWWWLCPLVRSSRWPTLGLEGDMCQEKWSLGLAMLTRKYEWLVIPVLVGNPVYYLAACIYCQGSHRRQTDCSHILAHCLLFIMQVWCDISMAFQSISSIFLWVFMPMQGFYSLESNMHLIPLTNVIWGTTLNIILTSQI